MADEEVFEVQEIVDKRKHKGHLEYKVKWKNYDSEDDTWEPIENLGDSMDLVEDFDEKMLFKQGLIQPLRIKIKSTKNKQYSSGSILTLKNPISPRALKAPVPILVEESPMMAKHKIDHKRTNRVRKLSMSDKTEKLLKLRASEKANKLARLGMSDKKEKSSDLSMQDKSKKLASLARQLSYDDYMDKYKQKKRLQNVTMSQWAQMSPSSKRRLIATPPGSPASPRGDSNHKHRRKHKHKNANMKRKRLPDSPDSPDMSDTEETVLYPFMTGTSSSVTRTNYGSGSKNGTPGKKMKRSYSAVPNGTINAPDDGEISFPKKRNTSLDMDGEGEFGLTTPQSTPPSTPNGSASHLEHASHKVPSIMTPMMRSKTPTAKVMSPTGSIKTKAFYSPPIKVLPQRSAGSIARRRLSQMSSMSSEDEDEPDRRFSMRVTENIFKYKEVVVKKSQGYTQVWLFTNSPSRNAVGVKALQELNSVLQNAAQDETKAVVLCGSGSMFCSGLDLQLITTQSYDERKKTAKALSEAVRTFVDTLINFPKLFVAAVNGPAIGFGAAILPLCDIVYASDKAYFHLPYNSIGMTPEGCSSFTYPHYLGLALASEMLYGGRKLTALEACTGGLVSQVLWPTTFMQEVIPRVQSMVRGSLKGLMLTKSLVRSHFRAKLEYTNESECGVLKERWGSSECYKLVKSFLDKGYE